MPPIKDPAKRRRQTNEVSGQVEKAEQSEPGGCGKPGRIWPRRVSPQRQPGNNGHRKRNSMGATGEIAVVAIGQATNHLGFKRLDTGGLGGAGGG